MEKQAEAGVGSSSAPDLNESAAYQQYAIKLEDLEAEVAKLVPPLTEENPQVIHLRSQIKSVEAAMASERVANSTRLKSDYQSSLQRETMLSNAYHRELASVSAELGKASEISLLRGEVESEQQLYQTLLQRAREAGFASAMRASTVRVVDAAKPNPVPFSPRRGNAAAYGLLMGTVFGVGLAFALERSATTLRAPGDVERYLGLRELGVIPSTVRERKLLPPVETNSLPLVHPYQKQPTLTNWTGNFSIVAEAYRSATTSIMLSEHPRENGRIYVVSSPNPGDGKTTVISNIGVALSKSRLRVLLIDGDLRKPALHKVLEVPNEFGLRNLLRGDDDSDLISSEHPLYQSTELPNLFILPSGQGSEEVVELLHSSETGKVLHRLQQHFDVIIIDTPPMLHMADARILASHAHGVILVVRSGQTSRDEATKARDIFDKDRIRLVGTILNDFDPNKTGVGDYYKSYQRYMYGPEVDQNGSGSWMDWLFSREPWILRRTANKGGKTRAANGVSEAFPAANGNGAAANGNGAATNGASNGTNGASNGTNGASNGTNGAANGSNSNGSHGSTHAAYGEIIPPPRSQQTFFMKVLGWNSAIGNEADEAGLHHNHDDLYIPGTHDRRRATRVKSPPLVAYYWDGGAAVAHSIRDISLSGVYVVTDVRWYPGTHVMIALQRPDVAEGEPHRSLTVNAKVVRFGIDGLGFSFVMPSKRPSAYDGPYSREAENLSRNARGPSIPSGANKAALISFLQKLPRDQDQG
jgi:capsular exopolysaccharide synthesis family protein